MVMLPKEEEHPNCCLLPSDFAVTVKAKAFHKLSVLSPTVHIHFYLF